MRPTVNFLAAPEIGRTRLIAMHRALQVVIENYSDLNNLCGRTDIYLSTDDGNSFVPIEWNVSWTSWVRKLGREWPPHDVSEVELDNNRIMVRYFEATYDGPVDYVASYDLVSRKWSLS